MKEISKEYISKLDSFMHIFYKRINSFNVEMDMNKFQGATPIELSILGIVGEKPDVILKDIIDKLQVPGSTLTNAIDRLEKRNLLTRIISKRDRRSYRLSLTKEGQKAYLDHQRAEQLMWSKILSALENEEEIELFLKLIEKVAHGIK